jgi:hypothetical protein
VPSIASASDALSPRTLRVMTDQQCASPFGVFTECPHCGHELIPEHAHFKCTTCGWRDSCCD